MVWAAIHPCCTLSWSANCWTCRWHHLVPLVPCWEMLWQNATLHGAQPSIFLKLYEIRAFHTICFWPACGHELTIIEPEAFSFGTFPATSGYRKDFPAVRQWSKSCPWKGQLREHLRTWSWCLFASCLLPVDNRHSLEPAFKRRTNLCNIRLIQNYKCRSKRNPCLWIRKKMWNRGLQIWKKHVRRNQVLPAIRQGFQLPGEQRGMETCSTECSLHSSLLPFPWSSTNCVQRAHPGLWRPFRQIQHSANPKGKHRSPR